MPATGLWRVAREPDPLRPSRLDQSRAAPVAGNRWDSEHYGVIYFATTLEGCFGETLARFRPNLALADLVHAEWAASHHMAPGQLPQDWRNRRAAVHVDIEPGWKFLDVESVKTRRFLQKELAFGLATLEVDSLDVPEIRGKDRRVTQLVSEWAFNFTVDIEADDEQAPFAGIFYSSRVSSDWDCWAVFEDIPLTNARAEPIPVNMPELRHVCRLFDLNVH